MQASRKITIKHWPQLFAQLTISLSLLSGCAAIDKSKGSNVLDDEGGLATTSITVDYALDKGPSKQLASGFHHGIGPKYPAQSLIDGVVVRAIRGADHHARLPSLFDPDTYHRVRSTGADMMVGLYYAHGTYWPGDEGNWSKWTEIVNKVLVEAKEKKLEIYSWLPWNEPDLQWEPNGKSLANYKKAFKIAFDLVKAWNPNAKVQGPEISIYSMNFMKEFLLYCKANNCIPDVLSWHELEEGPADIEAHTLEMKNFLVSAGIKPMPFSITEYQALYYGDKSGQAYDPGLSVAYIARLERSDVNGVVSALKGPWRWTGDDLGFQADLAELADDQTMSKPTAPWFVYNVYKDMTGQKVEVKHEKDKIEALASTDKASTTAGSTVLIGNWKETTQYDVNLTLAHIPSYLVNNKKIKITARLVASAGLGKPIQGWIPKFDQELEMTGDSVTFTLPTMPPESAYVVQVVP